MMIPSRPDMAPSPLRIIATLFRPTDAVPEWSQVYSPAYADRFARNAMQFAPAGSEVVIVTNYDPSEFSAGQRIVALIGREDGWANLMEMFRPDAVSHGLPCLLVGLDTVFVGPLVHLAQKIEAHGIIVVDDPMEPGQLSNAVVGVMPRGAAAIWNLWCSLDPDCRYTNPDDQLFGKFSEMKWMRRNLPGIVGSNPGGRIQRWGQLAPGAVLSYKKNLQGGGNPGSSARIVYFHGEPKPHQLAADGIPWVRDLWGPPVDDGVSGGYALTRENPNIPDQLQGDGLPQAERVRPGTQGLLDAVAESGQKFAELDQRIAGELPGDVIAEAEAEIDADEADAQRDHTNGVYREIYAAQAAGELDGHMAEYGHTNHAEPYQDTIGMVAAANEWAILDVGCGHNEFCKYLREKYGMTAIGVDVAAQGADFKRDLVGLDRLQVAGEYDLVTAFDVLEHLPPSSVDAALKSLKAMGPRFALTISTSPSIQTWKDENLHATVQPVEWWHAKLQEHGAVVLAVPGMFFGVWTDRIGDAPTDWLSEEWERQNPSGQPARPAADHAIIISALIHGGEVVLAPGRENVLACGPNVPLEAVAAWARDRAENHNMQSLDIRIEGGSVPMDAVERIKSVAEIAASDAATGRDTDQHGDSVDDLQVENARTNGRRLVGDLQRASHAPKIHVPPGVPGGTVLIVGAGPSFNAAALGKLADDWYSRATRQSRPTVYVVDRMAGRVPWADAYVTLEPRPVKLGSFVQANPLTPVIASVWAHPDRLEGCRVAFVQQAYCAYFDVPGYVPEVPPCRQVGALAVAAAVLTRPRRIVLWGFDLALGPDDSRYGCGIKPADGEVQPAPGTELEVESLAGDGSMVRTLPNYRLAINEFARLAERFNRMGIETRNATTQGAMVPGWAPISLADI